jgi:hypothetical protein
MLSLHCYYNVVTQLLSHCCNSTGLAGSEGSVSLFKFIRVSKISRTGKRLLRLLRLVGLALGSLGKEPEGAVGLRARALCSCFIQ